MPKVTAYDALQTIDEHNSQYPEIVSDSKALIEVIDHHDYVKGLCDKGHELKDIISVVATTPLWNDYVHDVKDWIDNRKHSHNVN